METDVCHSTETYLHHNAKLHLRPITLKAAQAFVLKHHRHNDPPHGHKFSIGLMNGGADGNDADGGVLIGVVVVGQPIARWNNDGYTAEITRCCVLSEQPNANSKLYAAALRAARAMGYRRVITYTLPEESGASLRAVGFRADAITKCNPNGWNMPNRPRRKPNKYPYCQKIRWIKEFGGVVS